MTTQVQAVKMVPVDAKFIEAVGYVESTRQLYIKFLNSHTLCMNNVPGFRYQGLMAAPRIDAYYNAYIKERFLTKQVELPSLI